MRNKNFDVLKSIALICIILAHVNPNKYIMQLRNFDVILMILVSVLISIDSIEKKNFNYKKYIVKRVKRLLIPTWGFLIFYFSLMYMLKGQLDYKSILLSFSLIGGIGYVWIIRIYIYVAIIVPIINKFYNNVSKIYYNLIFVIIFIVYTLLSTLDGNLGNNYIDILYRAIILDFIGYSLIVFFVINIKNITKETMNKILIALIILFAILFVKNKFSATQNFKYPLHLYFVVYSLIMSLLLKKFIEKINILKFDYIARSSVYLSQNSMGIYLWHILFISPVNMIFSKSNSLIRCCILLIISVITDYVLKYIKKITMNKLLSKITKSKEAIN